MRLLDCGWLTDENVHPKVVAYLRSKGLDVLDAKEQGWHGRSDHELLDEAYRLRRLVLTHDGDFGTLALLERRPLIGVVRIRPGHIRAEIIIRAVEQLLALPLDPSSPFLIVVQGNQVRLRTWSSPP